MFLFWLIFVYANLHWISIEIIFEWWFSVWFWERLISPNYSNNFEIQLKLLESFSRIFQKFSNQFSNQFTETKVNDDQSHERDQSRLIILENVSRNVGWEALTITAWCSLNDVPFTSQSLSLILIERWWFKVIILWEGAALYWTGPVIHLGYGARRSLCIVCCKVGGVVSMR